VIRQPPKAGVISLLAPFPTLRGAAFLWPPPYFLPQVIAALHWQTGRTTPREGGKTGGGKAWGLSTRTADFIITRPEHDIPPDHGELRSPFPFLEPVILFVSPLLSVPLSFCFPDLKSPPPIFIAPLGTRVIPRVTLLRRSGYDD